MRQRTKMNGLVSHTTPNGKSYTSGRNKCEMGIKKIEKLLGNGFEITDAKKVEEPEFKIVMVFGKPVKLTIEEYNTHWNFRVDK